MCASAYRPRRVAASASRSAIASTASEPAAGSTARAASAALGRPRQSKTFEITEAVTSMPILAGCT